MKIRMSGCLAAMAVGAIGVSVVSADSWRYGVLTDTQGAGAYPDVSTRLMAPVVDRFVNEHQVDMLLSVGDLSDRGSRPENDLWLQTAAPISAAGIPVYITRGNHDVKTETESIVEDPAFGPYTVRDTTIWDDQIPVPSNPSFVQGPGASFYFQHRNMFAVSLDLYGTTPTNLIGWLQQEALPAAAASGTDHRVLMQHETYFGKARSGVLQGEENGNPALELQLLSGMSQAGIDTIYVGHDHQYARSVAVDANGDVLLNHIVSGSNSEKYYRFEETPGPNEGQAININNRVSYAIVDVDGPMIAYNHYTSFAPDPQTTDDWTPEWELSDRMVYMTNGDQFFVEPGGSFAGLESTSDNGTVAAITAGTNTEFDSQMTDPDDGDGPPQLVEFGEVVNFGWIDGDQDARTIGDILVLDGLANDPVGVESETYTLELSYDDSKVGDESLLMLAYLDETTGKWKRATEGNLPQSVELASLSALEDGVNADENYVFAELNHNASGTQFAVVAVPEPTTLVIFGLGGLALLRRRSIARR